MLTVLVAPAAEPVFQLPLFDQKLVPVESLFPLV